MSCSLEQRRSWIDCPHQCLSVAQQCQLLGLARSSYYYQPVPESAQNLHYMRLLGEEYTRHPFYGVRKMSFWLQQSGHTVGPKRVRRLLRAMGLIAIYPKPLLPILQWATLSSGTGISHAPGRALGGKMTQRVTDVLTAKALGLIDPSILLPTLSNNGLWRTGSKGNDPLA